MRGVGSGLGLTQKFSPSVAQYLPILRSGRLDKDQRTDLFTIGRKQSVFKIPDLSNGQ